jgi:hypothetical protein
MREKLRRAGLSNDEVERRIEKVRQCANISLIPCTPSRCKGREPFSQEDYSEFSSSCLAYPNGNPDATDADDTCMRPENIATDWFINGRAADPLSRRIFCDPGFMVYR